MSNKRTVISHFYNEEYLLPWWLKHHREIFDDGLMINYGSTDRSVEIIKELCPNWTIVNTGNQFFGAIEIDAEIQEYERNIDGWRIVLNTTEFLLGNFSKIDSREHFLIPMACLVDLSPINYKTATSDPLTNQFTTGANPYFGDNFNLKKARLLHKEKNIVYPIGRHFDHFDTLDFFIVRFDYAPWNDKILARKMQIARKQPTTDLQRGWGLHHQFTVVQHENLRSELVPRVTEMGDLIRSFEYWRPHV